MSPRKKRRYTRRQFLQQTTTAAAALAASSLIGCSSSHDADTTEATGKSVAIFHNPEDQITSSPTGQWAMEHLQKALEARGVTVYRSNLSQKVTQSHAVSILAHAGNPTPDAFRKNADVLYPISEKPESFRFATESQIDRAEPLIIALGRDPRGLTYALTDLADQVSLSPDPIQTLKSLPSSSESPATPIRSITRLFVSNVEDLSWYHDRAFWQEYLTMLVTHRFNRFNLALGIGYDFAQRLRDTYFYFAYPFLLNVPGYNVRAVSLPDDERDRNLATLRFISDQAALRGLHFQLGIWTHTYRWADSPNANYTITGLDAATQAPYCRDALQLLLQSCPNIHGITFRTHGESGVPEGSFDIWRTIFSGITRATAGTPRQIELDLHAKGLDQRMIDVALETNMPVTLSPKFWAEHLGLPYHQASIRPQEMPTGRPSTGLLALSSGSRSFLRYGYGDLMREDRKYQIVHRVWPGTQRVLLWGDPLFAAEYARAATFAGSNGMEWMEPLAFKGRKGSGLPGGRDGYTPDLTLGINDWQKYLPTYRLLGRTLYNPEWNPAPQSRARQQAVDHNRAREQAVSAPDETPRVSQTPPTAYTAEFAAAVPLASALAAASRILPLITTAHLPAAANNNYWPELYTNMSLLDAAHPGPYGETAAPKVFANVSPLDPQLFSTINQYVDAMLTNKPDPRYSPLEVAQQLEYWSTQSAEYRASTETILASYGSNPTWSRAIADISILAGIGQFFAAKFRAAVLCAIFTRTGHELARQESLRFYRQARDAWATLADAAAVYRSDLTFGEDPQLMGHWKDRLPAIDRDIALLETYPAPANASSIPEATINAALNAVTSPVRRGTLDISHFPEDNFIRAQPLLVSLMVHAPKHVTAARLYYRHLNQAETFQSIDMIPSGITKGVIYSASIPAAYTNSPFPLQYYFELAPENAPPTLYPGFKHDFTGQPYFLLRQV